MIIYRTSPVILYSDILSGNPGLYHPEYRKSSPLKYIPLLLTANSSHASKLNFLKLKEIEKFESEIRQLEKNPKELLDAWREYIQHELKLNDPGMLAREIYRGGIIIN